MLHSAQTRAAIAWQMAKWTPHASDSPCTQPLHSVLTNGCLCWPRVLEKYGYVSVYVQCAGAYGPMSLEKGPNKGQGPLDGALQPDLGLEQDLFDPHACLFVRTTVRV